jgi:hypothetical protein
VCYHVVLVRLHVVNLGKKNIFAGTKVIF